MRGLILLIGLAVLAWAIAGPIPRLLLAIRVVDDLRRPGRSSLTRATPEPVVRTIRVEGERGFDADLYLPAGRSPPAPLIFVPGAVELGKDEPRVAPFARTLARAGFSVFVPNLPSFMALRVHPDNERELAAFVTAVARRRDWAPRGRVGLFGVSYAGGVALLVALDPAHVRKVSCVAAAGAYGDLESVMQFHATGRYRYRGAEREVRPDPYGAFVFIQTDREFLAENDRRVLDQMIARRMRDPKAPVAELADSLSTRGRLIYDLFERSDPARASARIAGLPAELRERMTALSPLRRPFDALRARLYLAHARDDATFPVSETARIAERAREHTRVRLVVLASMTHVDPHPWHRDVGAFLMRDLPEATRLTGWWYDLLGERGR